MEPALSRKRNQLELERSGMRYYLILSKKSSTARNGRAALLLYYLKFQLL